MNNLQEIKSTLRRLVGMGDVLYTADDIQVEVEVNEEQIPNPEYFRPTREHKEAQPMYLYKKVKSNVFKTKDGRYYSHQDAQSYSYWYDSTHQENMQRLGHGGYDYFFAINSPEQIEKAVTLLNKLLSEGSTYG